MTNDVAVQLVYLVAGADDAIRDERAMHRLRGEGDYATVLERLGGHIGMVQEFLPFAEMVSAYVTSRTQDFPGVFEYEVTEELGKWFARKEGAATVKEFAAELEIQGAAFFAQNI